MSDDLLDSSEADPRMAAADTNGDGFTDRAEFEAFLLNQMAQQNTNRQLIDQALRDFRQADADQSRDLDSGEWPGSAAAAFQDVDGNGDGRVTPREIVGYIHNNQTSPF